MGNISSRVPLLKRKTRKGSKNIKLATAPSTTGTGDSTTTVHSKATPGPLTLPTPPVPLPAPSASPEYTSFLEAYPHFSESEAIDELRARDFTRLSRNAVYLDYMGGGQHPESLVKAYAETLQNDVFGNTHSESMSSQLSERYSQTARKAVLAFFDADPDEYLVVWTANATAGLKLVGESFPFSPGSSLVLPVDAHNSVQGMRAFAGRAGADVKYVSCLKDGGYNLEEALNIVNLIPERLQSSSPRSLIALTGLSNLTNHKTPLHAIISAAHARGLHTILDAAALAPTTRISLTKTPVDAMVVSFYKMFGFPTGVGALIAKRSFLDILERPWFAGGAVDIVQVPGVIATPAECISSRFEEGTINYMTLPAITMGINILSQYIDLLPLRLSSLYHYLYTQLSSLQYPDTGTPVVRILSGVPTTPSTAPPHGYVLAFLLLDRAGEIVPLSHVEALAARKDHTTLPATAPVFQSTFKHPRAPTATLLPSHNGTSVPPEPSSRPLTPVAAEHGKSERTIALRTGCACNPGGAAALLGIESYMELLQPGSTQRSLEVIVGRELGVVRVSLGWVSDWSDVAAFIGFIRSTENIV